MKFLKQYWLVLAILLLFIALVLGSSLNTGRFRYDASKWAAPAADGSNMISPDQVTGAGGQPLFIVLGGTPEIPPQFSEKIMEINPEEILAREHIKMIRKNNGPVVLCSDDPSVSARVWMVLSETGIRNLYILREKPGPEVQK